MKLWKLWKHWWRQKLSDKRVADVVWTHELFPQYNIGQHTYGSPKIMHWGEPVTLTIGDYCSIAAQVTILLGGEHRTNWVTTYPFNYFVSEARSIGGHPFSQGNIYIGNDVWIGFGSTILSGVTIGNGAVIGAKSLVTKDIPPYAIAAGTPAKVLKYRFTPEIIQELEEIAWWNWPEEKIHQAIPLLLNNQIEVFLEYAKQRP